MTAAAPRARPSSGLAVAGLGVKGALLLDVASFLVAAAVLFAVTLAAAT